jgi:phosphopantetheinyl transferase (holo-ACP synthase)
MCQFSTSVEQAPQPSNPLTDEELRELFKATNTAEPLAEGWAGLERFARAIEKKLGIGDKS